MPSNYVKVSIQRWVVAALLLLPGALAAQGISGSSGGTLSERTEYIVFQGGARPERTTELVIILRGQPGWMSRMNAASDGYNSATSSSSLGGRRPARYSIKKGTTEFECEYEPSSRVLSFGGQAYPLDSANVVIIDHIDRVGGAPAIVRLLTLKLPTVSPEAFSRVLRQLPELQEYLH